MHHDRFDPVPETKIFYNLSFECFKRESNPQLNLGMVTCYHYTINAMNQSNVNTCIYKYYLQSIFNSIVFCPGLKCFSFHSVLFHTWFGIESIWISNQEYIDKWVIIITNKINNCYKIIRIIKYKNKFKIKMFLKNLL